VATIVLVHGIAQEQLGAYSLEKDWLPALADGVTAGGRPELAARIWPPGKPDGITVRMAYYGDLFLTSGVMGSTAESANIEVEVAEQLATEWLHRAVDRDTPDRGVASIQLSYLNSGEHQDQGPVKEAQRRALNAAARLKWFAPFGMAFAGKFVNQTLQQLTRYLADSEIREEVQRRVGELIDGDTRAIIGHSLGSIVAYEAAHRLTQPVPLLVTLGSPLGLRTVVYDRVRPQPPCFPPNIHRWVNVADRNDLVAAEPDLTEMFGSLPSGSSFDGGWTVENGAKPHEARFYLTKPQTGLPLGEVLNS
jgi:hypothetical protein